MSSDHDRRERFHAVAREVYEPLQRYLARRAGAADAADVFNESLAVIWRRIDDVPWPAPLPFCYGIARRCLANQRRGAGRHQRLLEHIARQPATHSPDAGAALEGHDPALAAALTRLTDAERDIVHLWAWEGLEPREIALVLDTTPNAVSVALTRARRKLSAELDRQSPARGGHNERGHIDEQEELER